MMSTHRENPKMLRHDVSPDSILIQVSLEIEPYPSCLLTTGQCAARVSPRNLFFLVSLSLNNAVCRNSLKISLGLSGESKILVSHTSAWRYFV